MNTVAILLMCFVALTAARPNTEIANMLKALIQELEHEQRGIGASPYGGTTVGHDYVELKVIRDVTEVTADSGSNKPLYSFMYGEGSYDSTTAGHSADTYTYSNLDTCANGQAGCKKIPNLSSGTTYWFQLEVELYGNNGYAYEDDRKDHQEFTTT